MILTSTSSSFTSVQSIWERGDRTAQQSASRVSLDLDQLTEGRALVVGGDRRFRKGKEKEFWFLGSAPVVRAQHSLRQIFFFSRVADEDELGRGHSRSRNGVDPVAEWNHTHQRSCSATEDYFEEE